MAWNVEWGILRAVCPRRRQSTKARVDLVQYLPSITTEQLTFQY